MKNLIIFSLEPLETRYTAQWHTHLPKIFSERLGYKFNIIQIDGETNSGVPTQGAFLDFLSTNQWKNEQVNKFFSMVKDGVIGKGDHILFTDAWNPTIIEVKYVNDLMDMKWVTHGMFHSGSYDPQDFLGRLIGDKPWVRHAEKSFFNCYDHNYFATDFHIHMFIRNIFGAWFDDSALHSQREEWIRTKKVVRTGWPMEYMEATMDPYKGKMKTNTILFPHRLAPEKQLEIFLDLAKHIPEASFIVCQEQKLTKHQYHTLLGEAKIVFSASLQETLGISMYEGALVDAVPLVPNRLSYTEMYPDKFKYPQEWTESWGHYEQNREHLVAHIRSILDSHDKYVPLCRELSKTLTQDFFSANGIVETINELR